MSPMQFATNERRRCEQVSAHIAVRVVGSGLGCWLKEWLRSSQGNGEISLTVSCVNLRLNTSIRKPTQRPARPALTVFSLYFQNTAYRLYKHLTGFNLLF